MTGDHPSRHRVRQSFSRAARLTAAADYHRVFAGATRLADHYFTLLVRPRPDGQARLGLAISKKQARRAVERNRLKRLIREAFRQRQHTLGGLDVIAMARAAAVGVDNATLRHSIDGLLRRASNGEQGSVRKSKASIQRNAPPVHNG